MNFLDQINQDKETAKSNLTDMLNQKVFDLLDTYASNEEIEVVTFSDEEAALSEEDLDEMTQEEFDSIDEEQLDELSKTTLGNYIKKAAIKTAAHATNAARAFAYNTKKDEEIGNDEFEKTSKKITGIKKAVTRLTKEDLDEAVGNLAGLSKHLLKAVTGTGAGEHSEVETHQIKNKSAHRAVLNKALDDGHIPVVYVNGKIHSAGHSINTSYGRPEFNVHDADKQKEQQETIYPKSHRYGGTVYHSDPYNITNPRYKKGEAINKLTPGHEASFYKDNKVEVKVIKADKLRQKLHKKRRENAPNTQDNYVNSKPGEKGNDIYMGNRKRTSTTTAGDDLKAIKDAAALKLATKKLGGDNTSANKKAMELHTELGKHLAAGNHKEAIRTANTLADHVRSQGLTTHADKIADYAKTLKELKTSYSKDYAKKHLANLRGETNESEELVEVLESMLTEMLDTNEAVVKGSVKKDKDGNVLSFKTVGDKNPEKEYDDSVKKYLKARKKWNSNFGKK